jgi:hypothetical protein
MFHDFGLVIMHNLRLTILFKDFHVKATIIFVVLSLCSVQLFAKESFVNFDFIDGKIENGFTNWDYSDMGENPCDVYNGKAQSKLCGPNGMKIYPYYNNYNNHHMGWARYGYIDASDKMAISGSSLKVQSTGGATSGPNDTVLYSGVVAKSKSEAEQYLSSHSFDNLTGPNTYPGDISLYFKTKTKNTRFSQFQGKNRFSLWILMPYRSVNIGTYRESKRGRPDQRVSWYPFINSASGAHYYHHSSNIPMGGWTKIQFDAHPTHNNAGSKNPYSAFSAGGYEFPGNDTKYFDNIVTFSIAAKAMKNQPMMSEYYIDELELDYVAYENEETINNIGVGFDPVSKQFDISFEDKYRCSKCDAVYEVRYSFSPITNANFQNAFKPSHILNFERSKNSLDGILYKPSPGYNLLWGALDLQQEHRAQLLPKTKIYFAVKDISKRSEIYQQRIDFETVDVPGLGNIRKMDLIKTIDYEIIIPPYPLKFETKELFDRTVGKPLQQTISAFGGTGPYKFTATNLPRGLTLSESGVLAGTPENKETTEILITVADQNENRINQPFKLNVFTLKDFDVEQCGLLVDFKFSKEKSTIADPRFQTIFHDSYTKFNDVGTTISAGSNKDYDYQGVKGTGFQLMPGDKVRTTWKNNSSNPLSFSPRISFIKQARYNDSDKDSWFTSSNIKIDPKQAMTSVLTIKEETNSSFINVNVNKANHKTLILDKIELVESSRPKKDICSLAPPPSYSYTIVDFKDSVEKTITGLAGLQELIKDENSIFELNGLNTGSLNLGQNFQGVQGDGFELIAGDQLTVTWGNNSNEKLTFSPLLSLTSHQAINDITEDWYQLGTTSIEPNGTNTSIFTITSNLAGNVNVINVSNNLNKYEQLILDKIELISTRNLIGLGEKQEIKGIISERLYEVFDVNISDKEIYYATESYLPEGLALSSDGTLEGIPEETGVFEITIQLKSDESLLVSKAYTIEILEADTKCELLVDFAGPNDEHIINTELFHSVIHDIYTGPSIVGFTTLIGAHRDYNYQGILGSFGPTSPRNKVRGVWFNNSNQNITFTPRISFTDQDRIDLSGIDNKWSFMDTVTIEPYSFATSSFKTESYIGNIYEVININVNYTNRNVLILDRIEYVDTSTSDNQVCEESTSS